MGVYITCKIKNGTASTVIYCGQDIDAGVYYTIPDNERVRWAEDQDVQTAVIAEDLVIASSLNDLPATEGLGLLRRLSIPLPIMISFADIGSVRPYFEVIHTTYDFFATVYFPGTAMVGIPSKIKILGNVTTADNYSVKVYDYSNGNVIAEKAGITDTDITTVDLGTLDNIPEGEAIFEIHAKTNNQKANLYALNIYF